jgi:hypothetical protein
MAYDFDGVDDYMEVGSAVVTGVPLTLACWFNPDNVTANMAPISVSANTGTEIHRIQLAGAVAGDPVRAQSAGGGTTVQGSSATGYSASTWQHAAARFSANNNRRAYLNGVGGTANTASVTPTGLNRTNIGCSYAAGVTATFMAGLVAEVGIWNVALDDAEIAALAKGFRPSLIRPSNLVLYVPLVREIADYRDGLTVTSSGPVVANHTRRIG